VEDLIKYLKDTLGVETELKPLAPDKLKTLPIFIVNEYNFQLIELYRQDLLLVFVNNSFTTERLKKHLDIIKAAFKINTVAVISQLEAYNRLRLIEKKVPFIIPGKQMYLSDLLIDLKEYGNKVKEQTVAMQPSTQLLLLYHLQVEYLEGVNFKEIAKKLGYNAMTISRAADYMLDIDICAIKGTKDKFLNFHKKKNELWKVVEPLMSNPIKKIEYYDIGWVYEPFLTKSNINALSYYSDINDNTIKYYAVETGGNWKIGGINIIKAAPMDGKVCIEEWKYNPARLTKTDYVDPLSLYLCFKDSSDERINMALDQIIKNIIW
jgi:hypothetical protein